VKRTLIPKSVETSRRDVSTNRLLSAGWLAAASIPLALLALCLISYIPSIEGLGFYWDDWPTVWFLHIGGPASFLKGFAEDRPLLAWMFMLTSSLIGDSASAASSALRWQLLGVFARWLASLSVWWTLRELWPRNTTLATWAAFLFAIYPGFGQQPISVTYSNAFLLFALFMLSLGSMIHAFRQTRTGSRNFYLWYLLSLITAGFSLFVSEYFFGLELVRPILLWLVLATNPAAGPEGDLSSPTTESFGQRFRRVILWWMPYLGLVVAYVAWHTLLHDTPRAKIVLFDQFAAQPLGTLLVMVLTIAKDFFEFNFLAWLHTLNFGWMNELAPNVSRNYFGIVAVCAVATMGYLWWLKPGKIDETHPSDHSGEWARQAVILGFIACLLAGWPIWITNLHFELLFPWDRFTLMTMLPTSILIAGLLGLVSSRKLRLPGASRIPRLAGLTLITLLISLSAGHQYILRQYYRQEWLAQKSFFWQLAWRIPALQPGTALLTSELPFTYYSDNSLTSPLNWIYAPDLKVSSARVNLTSENQQIKNTRYPMPYVLYNLESRLGKELPSLDAGQPIYYPNRITSFNGSTSQAVVLFYDPPRCVKVVDPSIDRFLPVKPLYINEAMPLSRPELILPGDKTAETSLLALLGAEPEHSWCYYFEQADLNRQLENWDEVAALADKALRLKKEFTQKNISELLPFIEGYAHTGQWDKAVELSLRTYQTWDKMSYILCDVWSSIASRTMPDSKGQAAIQQMMNKFQCP
jgi:hypothetical protein